MRFYRTTTNVKKITTMYTKRQLLLLFLLHMFIVASADSVDIDGIRYDLNTEEKTASVSIANCGLFSGCPVPGFPSITASISSYKGNITLPETVSFDGISYDVTCIGKGAFSMCKELTSISIPNSVTFIEDNAFQGCVNLTSVKIPSSVEVIGSGAFRYCGNLSSIIVSCNPYSIGENIFYACISINQVVFDTEYVTPILRGNSSSNIEVLLTEKVKCIKDYSFYNCSGITSVIIPNSVNSIGKCSFQGCCSLSSIAFPNSINVIGDWAFANCSGLLSLDVPFGVTSIGNGTFSYCSGLESISIPNNVFEIGSCAFEGCSSLTNIEIPENVRNVGDRAFAACSSLTSITIPAKVRAIEDYTFYGCSSLTSVFIPSSIISIQECAFRDCTNLSSVFIPNSVTTIDISAFQGCSSLTSAIIGNGIKYIYDYAFADCLSLKDVYCLNDKVPLTDSKVYKDTNIEFATLHVPEESINKYSSTNPWSQYGTIMGINGGEECDGDSKCATPIIHYSNGNLSFICETDGVEFIYEIKDVDVGKGFSSEVKLNIAYDISVYASKAGFRNSDVAMATLCWIENESYSGDLSSITTEIKSNAVLIQSNGGVLTITGAPEGTDISIYNLSGKMVGSATVSSAVTVVGTSLPLGSVAIVELGNRNVKVIIK